MRRHQGAGSLAALQSCWQIAAARLALRMGQVVNDRVAHRPAADQHLTVVAVRGGDRFCPDAVLAERALQELERVDAGCLSRRESTSCNANDVRLPAVDQLPRPREVEPRIARARRGCSRSEHGQCRLFLSRLIFRTLRQSAAHSPQPRAMPAARQTIWQNSPGRGALRMRTNWCPSADITISPGAMPAVSGHIGAEFHIAGAGRKIDDGERRKRHQPDRRDASTPPLTILRCNALQSRSEHARARSPARAQTRPRRSRWRQQRAGGRVSQSRRGDRTRPRWRPIRTVTGNAITRRPDRFPSPAAAPWLGRERARIGLPISPGLAQFESGG